MAVLEAPQNNRQLYHLHPYWVFPYSTLITPSLTPRLTGFLFPLTLLLLFMLCFEFVFSLVTVGCLVLAGFLAVSWVS
jgi:hypothetical protein